MVLDQQVVEPREGSRAMTLWISAALGLVVLVALVALVYRARTEREPTFLEKCVPYEEGKVGPRNWTLVEIEGKGRFWVDPASLKPSPPRHQLTPEQIERIRAFKEVLGDHDPSTLEQALDNFSRDHDPDAEIAIWEHVAEVWSSEIAARRVEDPAHARLIYLAVVGCSLVEPSPDALLSWNPSLKAVPDLAGLTARYRREGRASSE
jgi:hypothetical protein